MPTEKSAEIKMLKCSCGVIRFTAPTLSAQEKALLLAAPLMLQTLKMLAASEMTMSSLSKMECGAIEAAIKKAGVR